MIDGEISRVSWKVRNSTLARGSHRVRSKLERTVRLHRMTRPGAFGRSSLRVAYFVWLARSNGSAPGGRPPPASDPFSPHGPCPDRRRLSDPSLPRPVDARQEREAFQISRAHARTRQPGFVYIDDHECVAGGGARLRRPAGLRDRPKQQQGRVVGLAAERGPFAHGIGHGVEQSKGVGLDADQHHVLFCPAFCPLLLSGKDHLTTASSLPLLPTTPVPRSVSLDSRSRSPTMVGGWVPLLAQDKGPTRWDRVSQLVNCNQRPYLLNNRTHARIDSCGIGVPTPAGRLASCSSS
jgi:hypothetical protein